MGRGAKKGGPAKRIKEETESREELLRRVKKELVRTFVVAIIAFGIGVVAGRFIKL